MAASQLIVNVRLKQGRVWLLAWLKFLGCHHAFDWVLKHSLVITQEK